MSYSVPVSVTVLNLGNSINFVDNVVFLQGARSHILEVI
jgi:hypothetical protein